MHWPNETMNDEVTAILIVEDHRDAANVLNSVCEETFSPDLIQVAHSLAAARKLISAQRFNLALLDIGLPDGNGTELIQAIKQSEPAARCVITTIFDDDQHLFRALKSGADGYLIKGHPPAELKLFLIDAVAGKLALSASIAQSILAFFREEQAETLVTTGVPNPLTQRETEILQLIAKGCQVREASELLSISENTVAHHIKQIYRKLNVHNRAEATAAAVNMKLFNPD